MENSESLKRLVRDQYSALAAGSDSVSSACCGAGESPAVYQLMSESYEGLAGYQAEADLGLGCGLPTRFAQISPGDIVVDLGSGAGNDCFVARQEVGASGKVLGIDFSAAMIARARRQAEALAYHNVEFREGDLEQMPVSSNYADVVVSNCVLNLVPHKKAVIEELFRILKPGGHFSISDIVLRGHLPSALAREAELYAGCVAGAIQEEEYLALLEQAGFSALRVQKRKSIALPEALLQRYLSPAEQAAMAKSDLGIFSLTLYGEKPHNALSPEPAQKSSSPLPPSSCC